MPDTVVTARLSGPMFTKDVVAVIRAEVQAEAIDKLTERMMAPDKKFNGGAPRVSKSGKQRKGQGLGIRNNTLRMDRRTLSAVVSSTLHAPRTTGSAWAGYNMAVARSLVPRVVKKSAERIMDRMNTNG